MSATGAGNTDAVVEAARLRLVPLTKQFADRFDERECRAADAHWREHGFGHWALYQGQGYATEALAAMIGDAWRRTNADHVVAYTRTDHAVSITLMKKLGFGFRSSGSGRDDEAIVVYTLSRPS